MNLKELIFDGSVKDVGGSGGVYHDSIQAWPPIKNIVKGVVVTKDNRFLKVVEVARLGESEAITHRFFPSFQYEPQMKARRNTVEAIAQRMSEEADTARRYLDLCGLEVLEPRYTDNAVLELLYELINKGTSRRIKLPEGVFDMMTAVHGVYD